MAQRSSFKTQGNRPGTQGDSCTAHGQSLKTQGHIFVAQNAILRHGGICAVSQGTQSYGSESSLTVQETQHHSYSL